MSEFKISELTQEDLDSAYEVYKTAIPDAFGECDSEVEEEIMQLEIKRKRMMMEDYLTGNDAVFFVAKDKDKVIGAVSFGPCGEDIKECTNNELADIGEINSLFILPEYQNNGVGSALINHVIQYLKSKGIKEFCLDSGYTEAQKTWTKKFGKPYCIVKDYWAPECDNMVWRCSVNNVRMKNFIR